MVWILLFLAAGGLYLIFDRLETFTTMIFAIILVVLPILLMFSWVYDRAGITRSLEFSISQLAGVNSMDEIYPTGGCPPGKEATAWGVLGILIALISGGFAIVAIIAIPVGIVVMFVGFWLLFMSYRYLFRIGLGILVLGVAGVILSGLGYRLLNWMYDGLTCMNPS